MRLVFDEHMHSRARVKAARVASKSTCGAACALLPLVKRINGRHRRCIVLLSIVAVDDDRIDVIWCLLIEDAAAAAAVAAAAAAAVDGGDRRLDGVWRRLQKVSNFCAPLAAAR